MQDMKAQLGKPRKDVAECALIRDLASDPRKGHSSILATEVEAAIAAQLGAKNG
jgi:hypothetical protein